MTRPDKADNGHVGIPTGAVSRPVIQVQVDPPMGQVEEIERRGVLRVWWRKQRAGGGSVVGWGWRWSHFRGDLVQLPVRASHQTGWSPRRGGCSPHAQVRFGCLAVLWMKGWLGWRSKVGKRLRGRGSWLMQRTLMKQLTLWQMILLLSHENLPTNRLKRTDRFYLIEAKKQTDEPMKIINWYGDNKIVALFLKQLSYLQSGPSDRYSWWEVPW